MDKIGPDFVSNTERSEEGEQERAKASLTDILPPASFSRNSPLRYAKVGRAPQKDATGPARNASVPSQ